MSDDHVARRFTEILCSWVHASWIYVNNCLTRCDYIQFVLYFLQTALHVLDDTLIHHREHIPTVMATCGTGRTVFATVCWCGGVGTAVLTPPHQRMVANTVRTVPDVVITVWMCSWWWMRVSSVTCRAVCRKYNKTVYSRILSDNYWHCTEMFQTAMWIWDLGFSLFRSWAFRSSGMMVCHREPLAL